jgi:hypothetical protein
MIRVVPVVLAGRIALRVYRDDDLIVEAPLSRRRTLLIAHDLVTALLLPYDIDQRETAPQQLVAQEPVHTPGIGDDHL